MVNDFRETGARANLKPVHKYWQVSGRGVGPGFPLIVLVATRPIKKGEELLWDYGKGYWENFEGSRGAGADGAAAGATAGGGGGGDGAGGAAAAPAAAEGGGGGTEAGSGINKMKMKELKEELKARGLAVSGNKTELAERLEAATLAEKPDDGDGGGGDDGDDDDVVMSSQASFDDSDGSESQVF